MKLDQMTISHQLEMDRRPGLAAPNPPEQSTALAAAVAASPTVALAAAASPTAALAAAASPPTLAGHAAAASPTAALAAAASPPTLARHAAASPSTASPATALEAAAAASSTALAAAAAASPTAAASPGAAGEPAVPKALALALPTELASAGSKRSADFGHGQAVWNRKLGRRSSPSFFDTFIDKSLTPFQVRKFWQIAGNTFTVFGNPSGGGGNDKLAVLIAQAWNREHIEMQAQ